MSPLVALLLMASGIVYVESKEATASPLIGSWVPDAAKPVEHIRSSGDYAPPTPRSMVLTMAGANSYTLEVVNDGATYTAHFGLDADRNPVRFTGSQASLARLHSTVGGKAHMGAGQRSLTLETPFTPGGAGAPSRTIKFMLELLADKTDQLALTQTNDGRGAKTYFRRA